MSRSQVTALFRTFSVLSWAFIACVSTLEGVQVIVINSTYNNSTVLNSTNNFESIFHGLVNSGDRKNSINGKITSANHAKDTGHYGTQIPASFKPSVSNKEPPIPVKVTHNNNTNLKYFGAVFSPYVRNNGFRMNGYTMEDIEKMLKVIGTKCRSILTLEMGYYANPYFFGPYDATSSSKIATAAAQINSRKNTSFFTVSQGAYILTSSFESARFPDLDAAFYSAQKANEIFPGTVSSITLLLQDPNDSGFIGLTKDTAHSAALLLHQFLPQAHSQNVKLGVVVSFCDQILDPNESNVGKLLLLGLGEAADYLLCEMYPPTINPSVKMEYDFSKIKSIFEATKSAFFRVKPSLEISLFTGVPIPIQYSYGNSLSYLNSPLKTKHFWDEVERWSGKNRQKAYMFQAFDTFEKTEIGYGHKELVNGYWKRMEGEVDSYLVKGTEEVVIV